MVILEIISATCFISLKKVSEENLGASSGGGSDGGGQSSSHKKLILKRESCSCDSGDRVSDAGSRRSKSIGRIQSFNYLNFGEFICVIGVIVIAYKNGMFMLAISCKNGVKC